MWGEILNKDITNIKESFCLGEACLIFEYGKEAARTIAFRNITDLRKAQDFFKQNNRNFIVEILDKEIHITTKDITTIMNVVNNTHALRLKEVLDNYKK
jgi:hypothetical protein